MQKVVNFATACQKIRLVKEIVEILRCKVKNRKILIGNKNRYICEICSCVLIMGIGVQ